MAIMDLLGRTFADLSDEAPNGDPSSRALAEALAQTLLTEGTATVSELLQSAGTSLGGVLLATRLLSYGAVHADPQVVNQNSVRTADALTPYLEKPFTQAPRDVCHLIRVWRTVDPVGCQAWLRTQVEHGRWDALDIAGSTIGHTAQDGSTLGTFDEQLVDAYLGIDYLLTRYGDQVDAPEVRARTYSDTPEERRSATLYALRSLRDRQ